jgi:hypothetical protein
VLANYKSILGFRTVDTQTEDVFYQYVPRHFSISIFLPVCLIDSVCLLIEFWIGLQ